QSRSRICRSLTCQAIHCASVFGLPARSTGSRPAGRWLKRRPALKIVDTLHADGGHPCPGGVERARQIDGPASGLNKHGVEAEPACVHGGIVDAKIGGEPGQEDPPQAAVAQITRQTGRCAPVVFKKRRVRIDFATEAFPDYQLCPVDHEFRMKRRPGGALDAMIGPKGLLAIWHSDALEGARSRMRCDERAVT